MTKHHKLISSQIKLDNITILSVVLLISILNLPYDQTHIADELTYVIAKVQLWKLPVIVLLRVMAEVAIYPLSVFSHLRDKHFETDEKISCRIDESINTISIDRYLDLTRVINSFSFFWKKLYLISFFLFSRA